MSEDKQLTDFVSALMKFLQWQDEYDLVMSHTGPDDAAHRLMEALGIPTDDVRVLIGGSNCPIFQRAADEIERLRSRPACTGFATLILKGIVCGLEWEMLPDGSRGWRWNGYLRDAEVKKLCDFAREEYPKELRETPCV